MSDKTSVEVDIRGPGLLVALPAKKIIEMLKECGASVAVSDLHPELMEGCQESSDLSDYHFAVFVRHEPWGG
jgi:hypothetical protein